MIKHRNGIHKFIDEVVAIKEREFQVGSGKEKCDKKFQNFLDRLYEIRHTMSYEETREEIFTFISGGFDTTGIEIPAVILLLAMNPEIQDKLVTELKEILKSENDEVDEGTMKKMIYLDMVVKEAGRLIPAVLIMAREVSGDIDLSIFFL